MKILVVGCKGFIGSHLLKNKKEGFDIWGCDVFTNYNETNFFLITTSNSDFKAIFENNKFDVCINASGAASVPDSLVNPGRDFELNVHNVFLLLEAIRTHNPTCKFINISSAAVYGNPVELPVKENHRLNPLSPYGYHKLEAEQLCAEYSSFFHVATCSLRIFSAYGPHLKKQIMWDLFVKSKNTLTIELFGTGDETRDYIFIDDIIRAIEYVLQADLFDGTCYNLGYGEAQSLRKVSNLVLSYLDWRGELRFTGVKRIGDPDYWQADISKIKSLGFVPKVGLEEGIQKYAKWLLSLD